MQKMVILLTGAFNLTLILMLPPIETFGNCNNFEQYRCRKSDRKTAVFFFNGGKVGHDADRALWMIFHGNFCRIC